ncbi:MAG TPA: ATP phosphoribosyltransferase regulatory subunit, partial [Burkholderiales bacterium]|nr:ATP phosphoribosyltransferase regulatory subunit [Burkholderiales bacterium]
ASRGRPDDALMASAAAEPLRESLDRLRAMGLEDFVDVDLRIVRGLAYYTGIVFELFDAKQSLRAICGGGRYDTLIAEMAGIDLPCVGFGMGDVVLGELLKEQGNLTVAPSQLDAFLIAVSGDDVASVLALAHELRDRGVAVEYGLRHAPIRKQLELAVARGAPRAVIVGPEERKAKVAVVRDLNTGKQRKVALAKVRKGVFK